MLLAFLNYLSSFVLGTNKSLRIAMVRFWTSFLDHHFAYIASATLEFYMDCSHINAYYNHITKLISPCCFLVSGGVIYSIS